MSLLRGGPDVVEVYIEIEVTDDYGNKVMRPIDTPIEVRGRVQPSTFEESENLGQVVGTTYRFLSRVFPAGAFGKVSWDGKDWDIIGSPHRHNGSPRTAHYTTYIRARS